MLKQNPYKCPREITWDMLSCSLVLYFLFDILPIDHQTDAVFVELYSRLKTNYYSSLFWNWGAYVRRRLIKYCNLISTLLYSPSSDDAVGKF